MYAGVILVGIEALPAEPGVPRVCGGDPTTGVETGVDGLVFPVYAGVILVIHDAEFHSISVPRVCGGDPG